MKQFKSVLAMMLALVMIISCVGTAFAAKSDGASVTGKTTIAQFIEKSTKTDKVEKELKGFKSPDFVSQNAYRYAEDETVRAIVVLEGAPEADFAEQDSTQASQRRAVIKSQHNAVRKAMRGIDYEIAYEFTVLLNGFSCDVAYGDLDKIADIDGVEAVYIANSYAAPELETSDKRVAVSNYFTGNYQAMSSGCDGAGMVIAVLDTGLLTTHEAFQDAYGICAETGVLTEDDLDLAVAPGVYINAKVPFAYDYADMDADVTDHNGHGTHVSGIATGYAADLEEGALTFCGASPAAQLLAMKIFHDDQPGTTSDIYFYALEDAYRLGADVINMSIGAQNGFTYDSSLETEVFGNIYNRLDKAGVILSVAAGNEYSMAQYSAFAGYIGPEYPDYGTVASPSTYEGNTSVASLENLGYPSYVITIGEESFSYVDSSDDQLWLNTFANTETEFVVVPDGEGGIALGNPEDFEAADVTGKIAVVQRGEIDFQEKVDNAAAAGAIGCIVVNNQAGVISMAIDPFAIPAISVQQDAAESFLSAESAVVVTPEEMKTVANPDGGLMSDFSNWGTSPMLTIDPTMTSFGGKIYSSVNTGDSDYDVYSGTSMAAPNMTGTFSNVLSYLAQNYPELSKAERAALAEALLEGTAWVLYDEYEYPYSVRKQGAGLGNAWDAIEALRNTAYITDPLKELGDDPAKTGEYVFDVTFANDSENDAHFNDLYAYVLMDYVENANTEANPIYVNTLTSDLVYGYGGEDDHAEITYTVNGEEVTEFDVAAGSSVTVTVRIVLDDEIKQYFDEMFENGTYVEGYIFFDQMDEETGEYIASNHATFLAFYGDWTQAPILEQADFRDFLEADYFVNSNGYDELGYTALDFLDYYTSPNMGYTMNEGDSELFYYLGGNILGDEPFYEEHISFSTPKSDGTYYYADSFYLEPYQLRNARHLIMTVTDAETGEVYCVDDTEYLPKAVFDEDYEQWFSTGSFFWDGKDADGNYVPSGTVAHVQFDAVLPYSHDETADGTPLEDVWSFDVTVDYTAPVIESVVFDPEAETLTVTATDDQYLQAIYLADDEDILDYATFSSDVAGETFTATFDVSELLASGYNVAYVAALDYATNENSKAAALFETGLDATVTLVTPAGETAYEMKTGDVFTFPACDEEYADAEFLLWTRTQQDVITDGEIWYIDGRFFEDDELLVEGDDTFYALYAVGETVELEKTEYYLTQENDYSGDWAIVGLDYDYTDYRWELETPNAIGAAGEKVSVADLPDAEVDTDYVEFFTNETGIRFTFEKIGENDYTIKNVKSGKYLALVDGAIAMVSEPVPSAAWTVTADPESDFTTLVFNAAEPDMVLVYNDEKGEFAIYDDSVPFEDDYYPSEYFALWLYKCMDTELIIDHFTTTLTHTHTVVVDEAVAATCTETGLTEGSHCSDCGEVIVAQEIVPALGHDMIIDVEVAPTCTESGLATGCHCSRCDEATLEQIVLAPLGHTVVIDPAVAATLTSTGLTEGSHCSVCGKVLKAQEIVPMLKDTACYYKDFSDCNDTWYHEAVDFTVSRELMSGIGDGKFDPNGKMTRAMMVTVLYRMAGSPAVSGPSSFTDVPEGKWYSDAIAWAQDNGIVLGVLADKFDPNGYVTREQIATILWRYENQPKATADLSSFKDAATISEYAVDAMTWAVSEGIFQGDAGNLKPTANATRAEFACIVMRYLDGSYACEAK